MKYNRDNRYNNYLINYSYNKLYYSFKETCFNQLIKTIKQVINYKNKNLVIITKNMRYQLILKKSRINYMSAFKPIKTRGPLWGQCPLR